MAVLIQDEKMKGEVEKRGMFQAYLNLVYGCLERKVIFIITLEELCGTTVWCLAFVLCLLKEPCLWSTLKKTPT